LGREQIMNSCYYYSRFDSI